MVILREIAVWFLLFIIYSFAGWVFESLIIIFRERKFYNRGFLIGPICPIYGVGAVIGVLAINQNENILQVFCVSAIFAGVIEYTTSFLMEKFFHARWWDYSKKPFNINGRIYLGTLAIFGIMGVAVVKIINPFLLSVLNMLNDATLLSLALAILIIFLCDVIGSLYLILCFRVATNVGAGDATAEITANIQKIFQERGRLGRRLVGAFPTMKVESPEHRRAKKNAKTAQKQAHKAERKKRRSKK